MIRRALFKRDRFTCQACGTSAPLILVAGRSVPALTGLHADHIVPLAQGGSRTWANLQTLCAPCNLAKGARLSVPARNGSLL